MSLTYLTKQDVINELSHFYACRYDSILQQPWYAKEWDDRTEYGFLCGHVSTTLPFPVDVFPASHSIDAFLTAETPGYRYTSHGRSFLTQYYTIYSWASGAAYNTTSTSGSTTFTDTGGTTRTLPTTGTQSWTEYGFATQAGSTVTTYGLLAGTGTAVNSGSTNALGTLIANGSGAGQLVYGSMSTTAPSGTSPLQMTFARTLTNSSGGNITVTEAGLGASLIDSSGIQRYALNIRDVNAGGIVTINNGSPSTLTYTLSYTIA